jgi:hypothetical protein
LYWRLARCDGIDAPDPDDSERENYGQEASLSLALRALILASASGGSAHSKSDILQPSWIFPQVLVNRLFFSMLSALAAEKWGLRSFIINKFSA